MLTRVAGYMTRSKGWLNWGWNWIIDDGLARVGAFRSVYPAKLRAAAADLQKRLLDTLAVGMSRIQRKGTKNAEPHVVRQEKMAPPESNPRTRLPRTNGRWEGEPGNGTWYPDNPEAKSVLGGDGVPFKDGRPDFSQWSKGEIEFEPGVLNGGEADFTRVYEQIREAKGLPSNNAARQYLLDVGLTPHHHSDTSIQFIPSDLHGNIPHIGSASDMRNNFRWP